MIKKVIITGSTGMVGEGVLHQCVNHESVENILLINRKSSGYSNPKITEVLVSDFFDLSKVENLFDQVDACFFCAGVSSVGLKENDYKRITYDLTTNFAKKIFHKSPNAVFCYVSGTGTDSTEKGRIAWARIKGMTENALLNLGFRDAYMFRPGFIIPISGMKHTYTVYKILKPLFPLFSLLFPKYVVSLEQIGKAMIYAVLSGNNKKVLECKDIKLLAK